MAKKVLKKKTPEEIKDENERTNSMGLFNTAEAWWLSAKALQAAKVKHGHADTPVRSLYYHAIELYLKALLRQKFGVDRIRKKFGHNTLKLIAGAEKLGIDFMAEDRELFSLMKNTGAVIEARYIRTGPKTFPTFDALNCTCEGLRQRVGAALKKNGVMVRI